MHATDATSLERLSTTPTASAGNLAIFDLDRTLVPRSSLIALGQAMAQRGLVRRRALALAVLRDVRFARRGASDGDIREARDRALATVAGMERTRLIPVANEVAEGLVSGLRPGARLLLDRHLAPGDFCVVLSASPHELVEAISMRLGAHRGIGTRAEVVDGRFTGKLDGPLCYGAGKLDRLTAELGAVDLGGAWAYADSVSDLPLLEACGHPVAVNPDRRLRAIAQHRGWPVVAVA